MAIHFNAKNISKIAIFSAISYIVSFFEFPLFPTAPFLKIDFSNVFVLIGGFSLGPISGIIIFLVKELLSMITSQSLVVGQVANFLIGACFILLPTIVYKYKKGIKPVIITLILASVIHVIAGLLANRFINFPLYGLSSEDFYSLFYVILAFNLIKAVAVSLITVILYKRVKKLFRI